MKSRKLVINAQVLTSGGTYTSGAIDVGDGGPFGLDYTISGTSPDLTFTYTACGTEAGTYFTPDSGGSIIANVSATGGAAFAPEYFPYMKVKVLNNGANTATVSAFLNTQERGL